MTITRTIDGKTITIELTEQEKLEVWDEMEEARQRSYIAYRIEEQYEGIAEPDVYEQMQSAEVIDEIYEEASFRADAGWGSFESEADMMIESKFEELTETNEEDED